MKSKFILSMSLILILAYPAESAKQKPLNRVVVNELRAETQMRFVDTVNDHTADIQWFPIELWETMLLKDPTMTRNEVKEMLDLLKGLSFLNVVQADANFAYDIGLNFYSRSEIARNMRIVYTDARNRTHPLPILSEGQLDPFVGVMAGALKDLFRDIAGPLGENMHFFVLKNETTLNPKLVDAYEEGTLSVRLKTRRGHVIRKSVVLPLNSLYVPRKCPNGKDAHISWKFCPWTGQRLDD